MFYIQSNIAFPFSVLRDGEGVADVDFQISYYKYIWFLIKYKLFTVFLSKIFNPYFWVMDATDVITLEEAKEYLKVDFDMEDQLITNLIKSAVAMVEEKTSYMLYERDELQYVSNSDKIYKYPFALADSEDATEYQIYENRLYSSIKIIGGDPYPCNGRSVTLTIGYNDPSLVPNPLRDACLRLITYWYDQREVEMAKLPNDVYLMIRPWIRDYTI